MTSLTAIDLFSGCGGLTLGLKQAKFRVVWAVDSDPLSAETYLANHPEVNVQQLDIRAVEVVEARRAIGLEIGQLDLLAGCPPCQGFSSIRTLNGGRKVVDNKNDLVLEFVRFAEVLRPRVVMMENVPGLARDRRFERLLTGLRRLGYWSAHKIFDAADYGVPQRRRRLILLASRVGQIRFAPALTKVKTVRETIVHLPRAGKSGDPLHDFPETRSAKVAEMIRRIPKNGGGRLSLGKRSQLACHRGFTGFKDVYGRMAWDKPAPTITSGCHNPSKGRFIHPSANRAITLREAALLQGFPEDYFFSLRRGKLAAAVLIGNALPPAFVRQHALEVHAQLTSVAATGHHGS